MKLMASILIQLWWPFSDNFVNTNAAVKADQTRAGGIASKIKSSRSALSTRVQGRQMDKYATLTFSHLWEAGEE